MTNKYGLPEAGLGEIRERDKSCVYCHKKMIHPMLITGEAIGLQ